VKIIISTAAAFFFVLGSAGAGMPFGASAAAAQDTAQVRSSFEAGQYQQVIEAAGAEAPPAVVFAAVQSQQKLGANDQAAALARRLADLPEESAWRFVGRSAEKLIEGDLDEAVSAARRATEISGDLADAHYQLGLVLARRQEWREAAAAFDRVTAIDAQYAYGYYYGGLMHYRANRPDLMAVRFERFLKLAPEAPERPEVLQIMRTIRGR
jgi:tetratricopeptide (TPR) repeat protein